MKCPFCGKLDDRVVDSREGKAGDVIRRRRECLGCQKRFTSYERIEGVPLMVIKRDGKREIFDRDKLRSGLLKSVEKRPVSAEVIEDVVSEIESMFHDSSKREMETELIGEKVMERLSSVDQVAYVRFASVYRRFEDVNQFMSELRSLLNKDDQSDGAAGGGRSRSPRRR